MAIKHWDFSGWATKSNIRCSDGRTIRNDAFKDCDGMDVPLVWNHQHDDPTNVLGLAHLENRGDGVYVYCSFNDTEKGQEAKRLYSMAMLNRFQFLLISWFSRDRNLRAMSFTE